MGRTDPIPAEHDYAARAAVKAIIGVVVVLVIVGGLGLLYGVPRSSVLESVLAVGSVFVMGEALELLIARFSLPDAVFPLVAGTGLLALCAYLIVSEESPFLIAFAALAGGWAVYGAVGSLRTSGSGVANE